LSNRMSLQRQFDQINVVTSNNYAKAKGDFERRVMNDARSRQGQRRVQVKAGESSYKLDNRRGRRAYDDDDGVRRDVKQRTNKTGNQKKNNKHQPRRPHRPDHRNVDDDNYHMKDVGDDYQWVKVRLTIPPGEVKNKKELAFKDMMISQFQQNIPNFGDRDIHIDGRYMCIFLPRENINSKIGMIKDIIEKIKPEGRSGVFIPVKHDPWDIPISVKFENIPGAQQILMDALGKLYNTATNELDLSNLRSNMMLNENGMELDLHESDQFALLVRVLMGVPLEHCERLILRNNRLRSLQQLEPLVERMPKVKVLNMSDNQIGQWDDLSYVKNWVLSELNIENCPLNRRLSKMSRMKQQKEVRQTFKTVSTFNGKPFVARVGFDVGPTDVKLGLPKTRDSALPDVKELEEPLFSFIVKFIEAYDNDREKLFELYAKDAIFTMGVGYGTDVQKYRQHQRNMIQFRREGYNQGQDKYRTPDANTIKKTKLSIIALIGELPKTKHDLKNSTYCDVTFQVPTIIGFTLTGTVAETDTGAIRYFSRHMLLNFVESSGSFQIKNDQLFIRAATSVEQRNHGIKQEVESQPSVSSTTSSSTSTITDEMVERFCKDSGMKPDYSRQCLEENKGNYEAAGRKFMEMKQAGQIPAVAWITPP